MFVLLLLLAVSSATASTRYFISAPNVFHVGVSAKVSVTLFGVNSTVQVYLQDYPHRRRTFSQVQAGFYSDNPGYLTVQVNQADLPDPGARYKQQYVYLVAACNHAKLTFRNEMKILLSFRSGVILIQTDKPIYTPKQTVHIRVIPLDFNLFPSKKKLTVIVKNPQGIRVEQWKNLNTITGFISKSLELGNFVLKGNWTIEAFYDGMGVHNTSTVFEVREYVLPKFSVHIRGPEHILPNQKKFFLFVTAKSTYDKAIFGSASIRVKIVGFKQTPFVITSFRQIIRNNALEFSIKRQDIISLDPNIWFPEGCRLQVEAAVTERSTGITEQTIDNSILFTSSPYRIQFTNTAMYFRPGMRFPIKIQVTNTQNKPQPGIPVRIKTTGTLQDGSVVNIGQSVLIASIDVANKGRTDDNGKADFLVDVAREINTLIIEAETNVSNIGEYNGVKKYVVNKYYSPSGEYLMVRQLKPSKVGHAVSCEAFVSHRRITRVGYMVVARGQIVHHGVSIKTLDFLTTIKFQATREMSPSSRLVAYFILEDGEVISDTTTLEITDSLPNKISIKDSDNPANTLHPGEPYTVKVFGEKETRVGFLAVDQSVYLLRNKSRLTPKSVFDKLEELDLGCGPGSGKDTRDVFENSGVSVMSRNFVSYERQDFSCPDTRHGRKRRAIGSNNQIDCCKLGEVKDSKKRNCLKRIIELEVPSFDDKTLRQCKRHFFKCCAKMFGRRGLGMLGRSAGGDPHELPPEFLSNEEGIIERTEVRSYFPETWFFEEKVIKGVVSKEHCNTYLKRPTCHEASLRASLPHTITKWIVQAIAVSNTSGFGIAQPMHLTGFRPIFVSLIMPYSAQRGEQITILATIYNYANRDTRVHVYLTGNEGFCSMADGKKRTKISKTMLTIKKEGGSVSFPITIVPITYGLVPVRVYITNGVDNDAEERKLLVIPEGIEKFKTQTFTLDPEGVLKDAKNDGQKNNNERKNSTFPWQQISNRALKTQIDNVFVGVPKSSIPESVNAVISFTGNLIGPVTSLITGKLEHLIQGPGGCGEQNMVKIAPIVYVLQYLTSTNQMTGDIESTAFKHLQAGYIHELGYQLPDHSFNAFGGKYNDPGSTLLTALVAKVFCEASKFDGVQIDERAMRLAVRWLIKKQHADGVFPELRLVGNTRLWFGVYRNGDIGLTAYVVTALLECKFNDLDGNAAALSRAIAYLENNLDNMNNNPYSLALTTYALAMANSPKRFKANTKLTQLAIFDSVFARRHWNTGRRVLDIETTAYALLAQLTLNNMKYSGPIVTWLIEQKNLEVGFQTTTDTRIALKALAQYSEQIAGAKLDLKITIKPSYIPNGFNPPRSISINNQNALLQQSIDILPYLRQEGGSFVIETSGTGVAQIHFKVKYNLQATKEEKCAFVIKAVITKGRAGLGLPMKDEPAALQKAKRTKRAPRDVRRKKKKGKGRKKCKGKGKKGKKCRKGKGKKGKRNKKKSKNGKKNNNNQGKKGKKRKKGKKEKKKQETEAPPELTVSVCTQYKKQGKTGMAIVDVGVLTGYKADEDSLAELTTKMNNTIGHYEISDRSVVFYLHSIDSAAELCVAVKLKQIFKMGAIYPVPIKVYDYYEPDDSCTKYYSIGKSVAEMGTCNRISCRCTQDKCAPLNPSIQGHDDLVKKICNEYNYAFTAMVLLVDEDQSWLTYQVEIQEVIQQGNKDIKKDGIIELWKRGSCVNPDLSTGQIWFIMGRDKAGRFIIDNSAFVVDITSSPNSLRAVAQRIQNGECNN